MDESGAHAVEIRSTRRMFSKPQVETIVAQMEADHPGAECTLVLVGTVHPRLEKTKLTVRTVLERKPFDLSAMLEEAGQGIAVFRRSAGLPVSPAAEDGGCPDGESPRWATWGVLHRIPQLCRSGFSRTLAAGHPSCQS
jgi:hypothetical protein